MILPEEKRYEGSIAIPETAIERERRAAAAGVVLAVGPAVSEEWVSAEENGKRRMIREGDRVRYIPYSGREFKDEERGCYLHVVNDKDVILIESKSRGKEDG